MLKMNKRDVPLGLGLRIGMLHVSSWFSRWEMWIFHDLTAVLRVGKTDMY